ncbi:MAG: molecular chaperone SurA [Burkholderiaceae bacterium]|nr:MAG: molecular chaperone SurA [Burkholderiaceae bacterium]
MQEKAKPLSWLKQLVVLALTASVIVSPLWAAAQKGLSETLDPQSVAQSHKARQVDEIVAVVNKDVITRNELEQRLLNARHQLEQRKVALPDLEALQKQVLDRMIIERIQLQLAQENAIRIDDQQLDRAILRIAEQNNVSVQTMRDKLEADGIPFVRFREDIRREIILSRLQEREVGSRVQVSDAEIDAFLAERGGGVQASVKEMNLAQILLRLPENASPEQIETTRKRADALMAELKQGADFAKLAAANSNAQEALQGGELGWRAEERLPQLFLDAVKNLKPGEVAAPVKSANGFHILKLLGQREVNPLLEKLAGPPIRQTHARHILVRVSELVSQSEAQRRLRDLKQRLDNKAADFAELARLYSADGSAAKGGDLGWIYPGDTVPEFERAMDALQPGQISEPIETPFGWHLIQVLERRSQQASAERVRVMAREAVRERKADAAYQDWLRQIRDEAFVEIRLGEHQ